VIAMFVICDVNCGTMQCCWIIIIIIIGFVIFYLR